VYTVLALLLLSLLLLLLVVLIGGCKMPSLHMPAWEGIQMST
jgi:hypothetical protein